MSPRSPHGLCWRVPDGFIAVMVTDSCERRGSSTVFFPMSQPVPFYLVSGELGPGGRPQLRRQGWGDPGERSCLAARPPGIGALGGRAPSVLPAPPLPCVCPGPSGHHGGRCPGLLQSAAGAQGCAGRPAVESPGCSFTSMRGRGGVMQAGEGAVPGPALGPWRLWGPGRAGYQPQAPWLGL